MLQKWIVLKTKTERNYYKVNSTNVKYVMQCKTKEYLQSIRNKA